MKSPFAWRLVQGLASLVFFLLASVSGQTDGDQYLGELTEETGFYQSIRLSGLRPILRKQSQYQLIEVHHSEHFGKILVLDGVLQLTEKDAEAYNEMMAHLPMFQHPSPKRVLVIGGGDGYVVSEVLKHPSVERVDHVELDEDVVAVCREYFSWGAVWDDPRVHLHVSDGAEFVHYASMSSYDVIIQDSSDPWTWDASGEKVVLPSSVLYSKEHLFNIYRALKPDGLLNLQAEALQIPSDLKDIASWRRDALIAGFERCRYSSIMISTYPTGQIGCLLCEKSEPREKDSRDSQLRIRERYLQMCESGSETQYYHPRLQSSSFDLPLWAEKQIYEEARDPIFECGKDNGSRIA